MFLREVEIGVWILVYSRISICRHESFVPSFTRIIGLLCPVYGPSPPAPTPEGLTAGPQLWQSRQSRKMAVGSPRVIDNAWIAHCYERGAVRNCFSVGGRQCFLIRQYAKISAGSVQNKCCTRADIMQTYSNMVKTVCCVRHIKLYLEDLHNGLHLLAHNEHEHPIFWALCIEFSFTMFTLFICRNIVTYLGNAQICFTMQNNF